MGGGTFKNWSGAVQCSPKSMEAPGDLEGIARVVKGCADRGGKLRVVGSGHSFTPLVATDDTLLSLDNFAGLEDVDKEKCLATARAGTKLYNLNPLLDNAGLAMENLGDINRQSIAGAVSTGTHGTGIRFGNISSQSRALTLVTGEGEVIEVSDEKDRDTFKAAQVSLGALGVIARVRLQLVPAYNLHYVRKRESFDYVAEKAQTYRESNRHFEFFLFPHTDRVQVKLLNETEQRADEPKVKKFLTDVVLENAAFGAMSWACRAIPSLCAPVSRLCASLASEGSEVNRAHRVFSTARMVRFQEMEYGVPAERGIDCLREIKNWIVANNVRVHFPVECRFVKGDDIWLSPSYQRDTAYIAVHMYRGMEYKSYFEGVEKIFRSHEGRPHWGKMHTLTAKDLAPLYPMWDRFHEIRRRLDPKGVFMTEYMKRLFEG